MHTTTSFGLISEKSLGHGQKPRGDYQLLTDPSSIPVKEYLGLC